ncbi:hypothetical protein Glove_41g140 [Diversispora epigaea]|uniref:DUF659 domain-containing protein n=1 Tax=Diversispora epigaea TaxID=1348612 RepID=A0A397JHG8_9GLOM|nr:hypothetical protein Glove_41g140 [Diversispora epigaea]
MSEQPLGVIWNLYHLSDLSLNSHTAIFLAEKIENDNKGKYPHIENVRCIAHCINLVASHKFSDRLLRCINIIVTFFNNSHMAGAKLKQLIEEDNIKDGGLKLYYKTRWTTSSESVNSVLNLKLVLEKIVKDSDDNVIIEKNIDLSSRIILDSIGEVPEDNIIDKSDIEENE